MLQIVLGTQSAKKSFCVCQTWLLPLSVNKHMEMKMAVMNKSWHRSHQGDVSTKLQSCHQEKSDTPNTMTHVASIPVHLCISNGCLAGMSQTHHLVFLCCRYMNATSHQVLINPCIWDRPKWKIHHLSMNKTWLLLLFTERRCIIFHEDIY